MFGSSNGARSPMMKKLMIMTPTAASTAAASAGPGDFLTLMFVNVLLLHKSNEDRANHDESKAHSRSTHDRTDEPLRLAASQHRPAVIPSGRRNGGRLDMSRRL